MTDVMPWQDYGMAGLIVGSMLALTWWFVRSARADMRAALKEAVDSRKEFTVYLQETASKQTEALVAVGNALERSLRQNEMHEERAMRRHERVMLHISGKELIDDSQPPKPDEPPTSSQIR